MELQVQVFSRNDALPDMAGSSFFHSTELFQVIKATPGHQPLMAVAFDKENRVVAHLLACIRRRGSWVPPYLFTQGRIYGEGDYDEKLSSAERDEAFGLLLEAITRKFQRHLCLYAEFSNVSHKMFGYRHFREQGYFPVSWQEVHNSLQGMPPEERIDARLLKMVKRCTATKAEGGQGVTTRRITDIGECKAFYKQLRSFYQSKPRNFIPPYRMFAEFIGSSHARYYQTEHNGKSIGCCVCVYSNNNAYLWFMASKRKTHTRQHPDAVVLWHAIEQAYRDGCDRFYFMDAGLPFPRSKFREFILQFGGKPVTKYRWFRCSISCVNRLLSWLCRE
ncbi:MAG: GNAT family N-acetyltransferase [Prevotella sp.]|nr:GNAT family N-acetyltransferase [Prevotella sp.]